MLTSLEAGLQYLINTKLPEITPSEENSSGLEDSSQMPFIIRSNSIQQANEEKSDVELFFEVCWSVC